MNTDTQVDLPHSVDVNRLNETAAADGSLPSDDRRHTPRCYLPLELTYERIEGQGSGWPVSLHTVCRDVSEGGLGIPINERLQPGTRLRLTIQVPEESRPVMATGEVVWCKERTSAISRTGAYYEAGVRFTQLIGESKERFTRFMCEMLVSTLTPFLEES